MQRRASASHLPSGTRIQLSPALAPAAEDVFYSLSPWESSHCSHCIPSQTLSFHFFTLRLEEKSCFSRYEPSHPKSQPIPKAQGYHIRPHMLSSPGNTVEANWAHVLHLLRYAHPSSSQGPGPVAAASCKFFGSETAQLVQGNHSLVGAPYNTHF